MHFALFSLGIIRIRSSNTRRDVVENGHFPARTSPPPLHEAPEGECPIHPDVAMKLNAAWATVTMTASTRPITGQ